MKKILSILMMLTVLAFLLAACTTPTDPASGATSDTDTAETGTGESTPDSESSAETDALTQEESEPESETLPETEPSSGAESVADTAPESQPTPTETETDGNTNPHTYTAFTPSEKALFSESFGEVIPFLPNDEYYVEEYTYEDEVGINFYTCGNTEAEFEAYLEAYAAYTLINTYEDEDEDTWYTYQKEDYYVDLAGYVWDGVYCVDVYVYVLTESGGESNTHIYTAFTSSEKSLFTSEFGEVIPFLPNDEYYVEEYTYEDEVGINFYTYGNTEAEFEAYLEAYAAYTLINTYEDEDEDTWYTYQKGDYYVDLAGYVWDGVYCVDVYVYVLTESGGGDTGGGDSGGDENVDLLTNSGAGLPVGEGGVYNVDFTDATYVQDVTDQGYYLEGCPTVGSPGVLVVPIEFSDATAQSRGYDISVIENAFLQNGVNDYYSVYDYYYTSSYGQLELDITVLNTWFRPQYASTYYENATMEYYDTEVDIGDQMILDEVLAYLEPLMDLSAFDSDGNGTIDAIVLINTLEIGDDNFHWAYRYWNIYTDSDEEYYVYDGVSANDYVWASYQFLHEGFDSYGNVIYDDADAVSTYTYIHEFGHIIGADDYYDTAGVGSPMGSYDVMDSMQGDHNAYTKFNYGWLTTSRLVTTDTSVTLTLTDFSENGDTIILANNWDPTLGAYQEYYIVVYYRSVGLNGGESGYFAEDGIVVYHINATLIREMYSGELYYDVYYNNTHVSDEYGTSENLIEYVTGNGGDYVYGVGDRLPAVTDDSGSTLPYTFTVDALEDEVATLTFTKLSAA